MIFAASACSASSGSPTTDAGFVARYDLSQQALPFPTDLWRNSATNSLALPTSGVGITSAEADVFGQLNAHNDGFSTVSRAQIDFSAAVDASTVTDETVQVWQLTPTPSRETDAHAALASNGTQVIIEAPLVGWSRGATYAVFVIGGENGVHASNGAAATCDRDFCALRGTAPLPDAAQENLRANLAPAFTLANTAGIEQDDLAAVWTFTTTQHIELAIDRASDRLPLPIATRINPQTQLVEWPTTAPIANPTALDLATAEAKQHLTNYDGFSTSANLRFSFTGPIDASTVTSSSVQLWQLSDPPMQVSATTTVIAAGSDNNAGAEVVIAPTAGALLPHARYVVLVTDDVRDGDGQTVLAMPGATMMRSHELVFANAHSTVRCIGDDDAQRFDLARAMMNVLPAAHGSNVLAAWPFQTLDVQARLTRLAATAATLQTDATPTVLGTQSAADALLAFPLGIGSLGSVRKVVTGTIMSPEYLDPITHGWTTTETPTPIAFTATVPSGITAATPVPVMIFGHGVMTDSSFVLAIGDALASRGIASVAIDLPYHGTRTVCVPGGPISLVEPQTGDVTSLDPCQLGSTCADDGQCVDKNGNGNNLALWPVLNYPVASGAEFLDVDHLGFTEDHFDQATVDLGALANSLRVGDWRYVFGTAVDTSQILYSGESLGGILGATFLTTAPDIKRAVLNVPGANLLGIFQDSTLLGPQITGLYTRLGVTKGSADAERYLDLAHWVMDAADPQTVGPATGARALLLQMATLDIIIPNVYTELLQTVTGAPRRDYVGEHGFLVIPVEPAYIPGVTDLANFLDGTLTP